MHEDLTRTRDLLERYLDGSPAAEARLFTRYRTFLTRCARRDRRLAEFSHLVSPEDAADEALMRALAADLFHQEPYDDAPRLRAALRTVLDRVVLDFLRRMRTAGRDGGPPSDGSPPSLSAPQLPLGEIPGSEVSPTSAARHEEVVAIARRILRPADLLLWELMTLEGLDPVDIARRIGAPGSSVRRRLSRARARIALQLEREENG